MLVCVLAVVLMVPASAGAQGVSDPPDESPDAEVGAPSEVAPGTPVRSVFGTERTNDVGRNVDTTAISLQLIATVTDRGVVLRWAPSTARAWVFANDVGYVVERAEEEIVDIGAEEVDAIIDELDLDEPLDAAGVDAMQLLRLLSRARPGQNAQERSTLIGMMENAGVDALSTIEELRADGVIDDLARVLETGKPTVYRPVAADTLRPWTLSEWGARIDAENPADRYAAVAAQMLHGETTTPTGGGSFANLTTRTSEYENRYGFSLLAADLDADAARGLALRFTDDTVRDSARVYTYRVYPAEQPDEYAIDTAYVRVRPGDVERSQGVAGAQAEVLPGGTRLSWLRESLEGQSYTAYYIERAPGLRDSLSADARRELVPPGTSISESQPTDGFQRLTELPYLPMQNRNLSTGRPSFRDTTAIPVEDYTYRVYGITPFATLSLPTQVRVPARDITPPPAPDITVNEQVKGSTVRLEWELPDPPPDLEGFTVGIGNDPRGPFDVDSTRSMLSPSARAVTDSRAISNTMNYYVITAVDTAGNRTPSVSRYVHLVDSIPPPPPVGLEAKADSNGVVTMTWNLSSAPDLLGYKVYQANDEDDPVVLETGELLQNTIYVDTLSVESLTRDAYFAVEAVDRNNNISDRATVHVRLPDVVPPTAPVIRSARPTSESVELAWTASISEDVAFHRVMRQAPADSVWSEHAELSGASEAYTDTSVVQGQTYAYMVVAEDSAGLRSEGGKAVTARPYDTGIRPGIEALDVDAENGGDVRLSWTYPKAAEGPYWFIVYRAQGEDDLRRYLTSEEPAFVDPSTNAEDAYRYAVQVMYEDGGQSRLSDVVEVTRR